MGVISKEQFLSASKEAREELTKYFNGMDIVAYDLITNTTDYRTYMGEGWLIPMLNEGDLVLYMEEVTQCKIDIFHTDKGYHFHFFKERDGSLDRRYTKLQQGYNRLNSIWRVAKNIAKITYKEVA